MADSFLKSSELTISWAMRGLTSLVMILLGIVGYFMTSNLSKIDTSIKAQYETLIQVNRTLGELSVSVSDHIHSQEQTNNRFTATASDHELRLRSVEQKLYR